MEFSYLIFLDLMSKVCIGVAGFIAVRSGLCAKEDSRVIASITLYFTGPCSLFNAFQMEFSPALLARFGIAVGVSAAVMLFYIAAAAGTARLFRLDAVSQASLIYSNNGSFILSLVSVLMGQEALFYLSAFIAVHSVVLFTHGVFLISGQRQPILKTLLNPNILAVFFGFGAFLLSFRLPSVLASAVTAIGDMQGTLCMIMVGMALASCDFRAAFGQLSVWLVSLGRLLLFPAAVVLIFAVSGITRISPELSMMMNVMAIAASGPVANNILQVTLLTPSLGAREEGIATSVNTASTCLCMVTIPLITMLYQLLCA